MELPSPGCNAYKIHCSHGNRNYILASISAIMKSLFICSSTWFPENFSPRRQVLGTLWFYLSIRPNIDSRYKIQPVCANWPLYFTQCLFGLTSVCAVRVEVIVSCLNFATGFSTSSVPSTHLDLEGQGVLENLVDLAEFPVNRLLCTDHSPTVEYPLAPSCTQNCFHCCHTDCHWSNWLINCLVSEWSFCRVS